MKYSILEKLMLEGLTQFFIQKTLEIPKVFIYQPNPVDYVIVSLSDSIWAEKKQKKN